MIGGVILCVGDSLTHGARDPYGLHYPELLGRKLSAKYGQNWIGVEEGINGQKSADILRRFFKHLKSNREASEVCLWVGTNDAKRPGVPPGMFRENLESFVRMAKFVRKPLFIGLLPGMKGFGAPDYVDNSLIEAYNAEILDLVDKHNDPLVWYVDLRDLPVGMFCDGIHLTHEGNQWAADKFMAVIERERTGRWGDPLELDGKATRGPSAPPKQKATTTPSPCRLN